MGDKKWIVLNLVDNDTVVRTNLPGERILRKEIIYGKYATFEEALAVSNQTGLYLTYRK